MTVRSRRFAGPVLCLAQTNVNLFTVPAGERWLLKVLTVTNLGAATANTHLYLNARAAANLVRYVPLTTGASADIPLGLVLNAGETLIAYRGNADASWSSIVASGVALQA